MRKPAFCICKNKDADQLRGNREADQRLCFRYSDMFCDCAARFVSDLVGNPEDRFSHNEAYIVEISKSQRVKDHLYLCVSFYNFVVHVCKNNQKFAIH